jgi:protein gp37
VGGVSQQTAIEWTDVSWNPTHGCSKVPSKSPLGSECEHCYAETLSLRYGQTAKPWTAENAAENVLLKPHKLREPLSKRKPYDRPCMVFVNSMSDLFHPRVPSDYIGEVFDVMERAPQHTFQVLTKRPKRMRSWVEKHRPVPLPNVWLGTSIGLREWVGRADVLRETPAAVRFISAEPLLEPLVHDATEEAPPGFPLSDASFWSDRYDGPDLDLRNIHWLIVGGESGAGHRPMRAEWVRDLRDRAVDTGVAFFFKQWGGIRPKSGGRELDGRTWDEMPAPPPVSQEPQR